MSAAADRSLSSIAWCGSGRLDCSRHSATTAMAAAPDRERAGSNGAPPARYHVNGRRHCRRALFRSISILPIFCAIRFGDTIFRPRLDWIVSSFIELVNRQFAAEQRALPQQTRVRFSFPQSLAVPDRSRQGTHVHKVLVWLPPTSAPRRSRKYRTSPSPSRSWPPS
jgi:hypothetical protein